MTIPVPLDNLWNREILIGATILLQDGQETDEAIMPLCEVYMFGKPNMSRVLVASGSISRDDALVAVDTSTGDIEVTLLPAAEMLGRTITVLKQTEDEHLVRILDVDHNVVGLLEKQYDSLDFRAGATE